MAEIESEIKLKYKCMYELLTALLNAWLMVERLVVRSGLYNEKPVIDVCYYGWLDSQS